MGKRNLKRFLALVLALLMVMACCALATPVVAVMAGSAPLIVGLIVLIALSSWTAVWNQFVAPKSRGDPKSALDHSGVFHDGQMMSSGHGRYTDARKEAWRPPRHRMPGAASHAGMHNDPTFRPIVARRSAKDQLSSYAFNARDRDGSVATPAESVLMSGMKKAHDAIVAFVMDHCNLFAYNARDRDWVPAA